MDSLFNSTEGLLDHEMTRQEFYQQMLPFVSQIKCGHTKFHPDENWTTNYYFNIDKVFPVKLFIQPHQAFFVAGYNSDLTIPAGAELISINNRPIDTIINRLVENFLSDGNNSTFKYLEMSHYFSAYYANLYEPTDSFLLVYRDQNRIKELTIPSISHSFIDLYEKRIAGMKPEVPPYKLDWLSDNTVLMTISSFWMNVPHLSFKQFLKSSFAEINKKGIKHLIIDLRDNEGGIDARGSLLLSYLVDKPFRYYDRLEVTTNKKYSFTAHARLPKFYNLMRMLVSKTDSGSYVWKHNQNLKFQKPQKNPFTGKVYVLTNGASFSVSAEFAAVTHYLKRATFIGEETGGGYYGNNSGTFVIVTLPNSRMNLGIPMMAYYLAVKDYPYKDKGVIPDYEVNQTIQSILEKKDVVLTSTLQLIKKL